MYTPISNIVVTAAMRWPSLGLALSTLTALFSDNMFATGAAWVVSVVSATYLASRQFSEHFCECEEELVKKGMGLIPTVSWVVEHNPDSGSKRPWELYSMFGNDESTKQHYASYSSEEHALERKKTLEG